MYFFIKEWPDKTATFMTDTDQVLWTFTSLAEARQACRNYYAVRIHTDQHSMAAIHSGRFAPPAQAVNS